MLRRPLETASAGAHLISQQRSRQGVVCGLIRGMGESALEGHQDPDHADRDDRRHAQRRLVDAAFLDEARRILRPGGSLRLMTDDAPYFSAMCSLTASGWQKIDCDDGRDYVRTSFEKRFLDLGMPPFRCALRPLSNS